MQRNSDEKYIINTRIKTCLIKNFNISLLNITYIRYALIYWIWRVINTARRGQCGAVHRAHVRLLRLTGHRWDAPQMQPNETRKTESEREKKGTRATTGQTLPVYISTSLLWGTVPLENNKITQTDQHSFMESMDKRTALRFHRYHIDNDRILFGLFRPFWVFANSDSVFLLAEPSRWQKMTVLPLH